jgi:hypothetical protein
MTTPIDSLSYAKLAQNSYDDPKINLRVKFGGLTYTAILSADHPETGFQATAYDRTNTDGSHNIVISYRGTEFGREPLQDGIVDAGMALAGINAPSALLRAT